MTDLTYIPRYLIEAEKLEEEQQPKSKSKYSLCKACQEYVHEDDWSNHRRIYCDPGHKRKREWTTRPTSKRIIGGYVLGVGVNPRPLTEWPKQVLRGACRTCGRVLVDLKDVCCVVCSGVRGKY